MRIRLLIAVVAVAVLGVIATPGLAQAKPKGTTEEECIKKLEAGGVIDDCQKAPSPILPETNEIVWGGLAFVVLLLVMWKYALPPVRNMMKQREDRIRDDLERAEHPERKPFLHRSNYLLADANCQRPVSSRSAARTRLPGISRSERSRQCLSTSSQRSSPASRSSRLRRRLRTRP